MSSMEFMVKEIIAHTRKLKTVPERRRYSIHAGATCRIFLCITIADITKRVVTARGDQGKMGRGNKVDMI